MKTLFIIIFIFQFPSLQANAGEALIRSGDHKGFSRLFAYTGKNGYWRTSRADGRVTIQSEIWASGFNTAGIFEKISRRRISSVSSFNDSLVLELGCDCEVEVSQFGDMGILIDVIDPISYPTSLKYLEFDINRKFKLSDSNILYSQWRNFTFQNTANPLIQNNNMKFENEMDHQIQHGSNPNHLSSNIKDLEVSGRLHISNNTNLLNIIPSRNPPSDHLDSCPLYEYGDIKNWSSDSHFYKQLGSIRRNIISESGEVSIDNLVKLARLFASFAMTDESRAIIELYQLKGNETNHLMEILNIIDNKPSHHSLYFDIGANCFGSTRIWGLLAGLDASLLSRDEVSEVYSVFLSWPKVLIDELAGRVGESISVSSEDAKDVLLRATKSAKLTKMTGVRKPTEELFKALMHSLKEEDFEVRIETKLATWASLRHPLSSNELRIIESLAFELGSHSVASSVRRSLLYNKILIGQYSDAIAKASSYGKAELRSVIEYAFADPDLLKNSAKAVLFSNAVLSSEARHELSESQREALAAAQNKYKNLQKLQSKLTPPQENSAPEGPPSNLPKNVISKRIDNNISKNTFSLASNAIRSSQNLRKGIKATLHSP